ncbi:hypothetical protein [Flavobacterium sp. WC2509]|uniref:hypothetical protein n=1 Tax=Flavobacterium sp. WC2509 TaxID=3461406 RepID=UPI0040444E24
MNELDLKVKKKRVPHNLIVLTEFQEKFIRKNFFKLTNPQIAEAIGLNLTTTRKHCYRMGFKRMDLEYWCETAVRFLRLYYRKIGDTEIAEIFTKHFPKEKKWTKKHIEKKRRYLFLKRTEKEISAIKERNRVLGRFSMCATNMWKTRGVAKIGDVRIWNHTNGVEMAFVKLENGFVPRNRWLWVQAYGELNDDDIIRSKPGAPLIAELSDLVKIDRLENASLNKMLPRSIVKTMFKIKDNVLAQQIADEYPELIEMKLKMLTLNKKINGRN